MDRRTNALANSLASEGVGGGDSVAIMCRDHRWFVEATVAISKLGATALYYDTAFDGPQLREVTEREDPAAIAYDEEFAELIEEGAGERSRWVARHVDDPGETTVEDLIEAGDDSDLPAPRQPWQDHPLGGLGVWLGG